MVSKASRRLDTFLTMLSKLKCQVDPVSKNSGNFEDDLRARLAQRREAFGGGRDDLGTLSSLIPVDSDVKGEAEEGKL